MRAERLNRKSHFKRLSGLPENSHTVYDYTRDVISETVDPVSVADLYNQPDAEFDYVSALPYGFSDLEDVLYWCGAVMKDSPTANALLSHAGEEGWDVALAELHSNGFYLDIPEKKIYLDHFSMKPAALGRSVYFRNAVLTTFIRALRDVWHESRSCAYEEEFKPEDALYLERVRAADCDTVAILAAWELRGAGYSEIWRHLLGTEEGDMALVFTRFLERDPSALFDGSALAYAFRQWYADDARVDGCDHETLESLDDLLLTADETRPFGTTELTARMIENLSLLPDGICYLAGLGETIRRDPFFIGLHDPINQTHLFHIMYDMEVTVVNNVPFRDKSLAGLIFPEDETLYH